MQREYSSGDSSDVKLFLGKEVEHTPAFGMKTLFVAGLQSVEDIEKLLVDPFTNVAEPVKHIFFGANHSYNPQTNQDWEAWDKMITYFLQKGYLCSLDIPMSAVEGFNDGGLCEYDNFIPQIRVPIPYIRLWNYNTMLKIDDRDFKATNPGVWSHSLHTLMDRSKFTDWNQYTKDEILK
jgi:hypothetical protein